MLCSRVLIPSPISGAGAIVVVIMIEDRDFLMVIVVASFLMRFDIDRHVLHNWDFHLLDYGNLLHYGHFHVLYDFVRHAYLLDDWIGFGYVHVFHNWYVHGVRYVHRCRNDDGVVTPVAPSSLLAVAAISSALAIASVHRRGYCQHHCQKLWRNIFINDRETVRIRLPTSKCS